MSNTFFQGEAKNFLGALRPPAPPWLRACTELNNVKTGCSIGKVLLNHLMFADDICVFCFAQAYEGCKV